MSFIGHVVSINRLVDISALFFLAGDESMSIGWVGVSGLDFQLMTNSGGIYNLLRYSRTYFSHAETETLRLFTHSPFVHRRRVFFAFWPIISREVDAGISVLSVRYPEHVQFDLCRPMRRAEKRSRTMRIPACMLLMILASLLGLATMSPMRAAGLPKPVPPVLQRLPNQGCEIQSTYQLPRDFQRLLPSMVIVQNSAQIGSGVIVSEDGHVLTAAHLVRNADWVAVYLNSGETVQGRILHTKRMLQPDSDIAIIKIPGQHYPCLPISTEPLSPGSRIFSIGFSFADENGGFTMQEGTVGPYHSHTALGTSALQTTLNLAPGSSGGPLLNAQGQVVGIITGKIRLDNHQIYSFGTPVINTKPQ